MTRTKEILGFHDNLDVARANGVPYATYWSRCVRLDWDPRKAATRPPEEGRVPSPASIRSRCAAAGINRRRYYDIKDELEDLGAEHTKQDIIDIAVARKENSP